MIFKSKNIKVGSKVRTDAPFTFEGKASTDYKNIKATPSCGCTGATFRVLRNSQWQPSTRVAEGEAFRVTGKLNNVPTNGSVTKKVTITATGLAPIPLLFTMYLV